jgi:hypothetical protein
MELAGFVLAGDTFFQLTPEMMREACCLDAMGEQQADECGVCYV